jgi:Na+/H+-dicarboxylate symporter
MCIEADQQDWCGNDRQRTARNRALAFSEAMFKVTLMIMNYTPIGVFGMISLIVANFGFSIPLPLAKLICSATWPSLSSCWLF